MYSPSSTLEKSFMKLYAVSVKTLKILKYLQQIFFNMDIVDLCLLPSFCIIFKTPLENVTKVSKSKVILENLKISGPRDA